MIQIIEIENPFEPQKRKTTESVFTGREISAYVNTENKDIYLNGHKVDEPDKTIPSDGSQVIVTPHIAGKALRGIFGIIAMVALSAFAAGIPAAGGFGLAAHSFGAYLASGAVMFLGGKIVNAIFPQQTANLGNFEEQQQSQSYGWDLPTPSTAAGGVIGETYGECIPSAQLLEQHVETVGDEQYLNLLYCGGYGPVDSIDDIRIEYTSISNFDGVQLETRLGTNDQRPISFFKNTPLDQSVGIQLKENESVIRTSDSTKATGLEVTLEFPGGLFHVKDNGNYENCTAKFKLEYRKGKSDNWHNFDKGNAYRTFDVTAATNSEVRRIFSVYGLEAGQYDVRVTAVQRPHGSRDQSLVNWSIMTSFLDGVYCRPNKVLVAMRIKASSQLSSGVPSVNWRQTRKTVWVHNPNTNQYEQKAADNPIWACYDILHGARRLKNINTGQYEFAVYGYPASSFDSYFDEWKEAADYADEMIVNQDGEKEPRYRFDAFFDTNQKRWNAAQKAANVGHAAIIPHGRDIGITVDKPGHITQIFGEGRTEMSSFKGSFSSKEDRAKAIEVTYNDGQNDFKNTVMTVRSPNYNTDETSDNTAQLSLFGVKRRSQAYREAVTALATNERQLQFVELSADIDAIVAEYGDIIGVNHTVGRIGMASGRVVAVDGNTVTIDKKVDLIGTKKYEIIFMLGSDALVKREVAATNGSTNVLRVTLPFDEQQVPQKFDNYAFGEVDKAVKPFRVVNATRNGDLKVSLKLAEYDEAMYSAELDYERYPVIDYTNKPTVAQITNLSATEQSYTVDRTTISDIDVTWQTENTGLASDSFIVDVQSRNSSFHERYSTRFTTQKVTNVHQNETYTVTVYCVYDGVYISHVTTEVFVHGSSYSTNNPTNLVITQNGKGFNLSWSPALSSDIVGYNVYQGTGGAELTVCKKVSSSQKGVTYYASVTSAGTYQFYVKCVNKAGEEVGEALSGVGQITAPGTVSNASVVAHYRQYEDGSTGYDVITTFTLPSSPGIKSAEVWYKTNHLPASKISGKIPVGVPLDEIGFYADWQYAGDGVRSVIIPAAKVGDTYHVKIIAVDVNGFTTPDSDAKTLTIKIEAKTTVPNTPANFRYNFKLNAFNFSWDDVTNSDVDFYELRLDTNPGSEIGLLARVQGTSVTLAKLDKREAVVYLYAHNATKKYGHPAKLSYSFRKLDAPVGIKIEDAPRAVNITIPEIIDGAAGVKLYIKGIAYDLGTGLVYCYSDTPGVYQLTACYYDEFGNGYMSAKYPFTIQATIDPDYIADGSLTAQKMDKIINDAVKDAQNATPKSEFQTTVDGMKSTAVDDKKELVSQIQQNSNKITGVVTNLGDATKARNYSAIAQMQDGIAAKVSKDGIVAALNLSKEGLLIDGRLTHITGDTQIDGNVITSGMLQANSITSRELSASLIALKDSQGIQGGSVTLDADGMTVVNSQDGSSVVFGQNGMEFVGRNQVRYAMVGASLTGTANDGQYVRFVDGEGNPAPWQSAPNVITMFREVQSNHPNYSTSNIFIHCYPSEITENGFRMNVYSGISNGTGSRSQYQDCGYAYWDVGRYQFRMERPIGSWKNMSFTVAMPSNASRAQLIGHFSVNRHYKDAYVCLHGAGHNAIESQRFVVTCNGTQTYNGVIIDDSQGVRGNYPNQTYWCGLNSNKDSWNSTYVSSIVFPVIGGASLNCTLSLNPVTIHPGDGSDGLEIKFYIDSINFWVDGEQRLASGNASFIVLDAKNGGYYKTE